MVADYIDVLVHLNKGIFCCDIFVGRGDRKLHQTGLTSSNLITDRN